MDDAFVPILSMTGTYCLKHQKVLLDFEVFTGWLFFSFYGYGNRRFLPLNGLQIHYDTPTHGSKGRKMENDMQILWLD